MKTTYYLLDSENIPVKHLIKNIKHGELKIKRKSTLIIFFNRKTVYDHNELEYLYNHFKEIIIEESNVNGSSALDFYLVSCLAVLAARNSSSNYNIVSNDKGYLASIEALEKYLTSAKFNLISLSLSSENKKVIPDNVESINDIKTRKENNKRNNVLRTFGSCVKAKLKDNSKDYTREILTSIDMSKSKEQFHRDRIDINNKYGLKEHSFSNIEDNYELLRNKA